MSLRTGSGQQNGRCNPLPAPVAGDSGARRTRPWGGGEGSRPNRELKPIPLAGAQLSASRGAHGYGNRPQLLFPHFARGFKLQMFPESPFRRQLIFPESVPIALLCANDCPHLAAGPAPGSGAGSPEELRATPPRSHPGQTDGGSPPVGGGRQALGLSALLWSKIPRDSHLQPSAATEAFSPTNARPQPPLPAPMTSAASRDLTPATGCAMLKSRN